MSDEYRTGNRKVRVVVPESPHGFSRTGHRVAVKVGQDHFDPMKHPRDRYGRFIETGAEVRIVGGFLGTVLKNVGGGNIEVHRSDGKNVIVNRGHLTVIKRPDGSTPIEKPDDSLSAAPVQTASPDAVHVDEHGKAPDDGPEHEADKPGTLTQVAISAQVAADLASTGHDPANETPTVPVPTPERNPDFGKRVGTTETPGPGNSVTFNEQVGGRNVGDPPVSRVLWRVERRDGVWGVYGPNEQVPASFQTGHRREAVQWARDRVNGVPEPSEDAGDTADVSAAPAAPVSPSGMSDLFGDAEEPTDQDVADAAADDDPPDFDFQPDAKAPAPEEPQETETMETVYDIRPGGLPAAIASIETANRRADRSGVEDRFEYSVETYKQRIPSPTPGIPDEVEVRHRLTLNRPTIQHDGWTFAATLTWDPEAGLVTRTVPGATLFSRPEARQCDVCHSQRDRRDTYIVQKGDEQQQVGSSCLQQFMGISPSGLWMLAFEPDTGGEEGGGPGGYLSFNDRRFDSQQMLALTFAVARDQGWISRGNAQATERRATADRVAEVLTGSLPSRDPARAEEMAWQEKMRNEAVGLMDDAQSILDTARTMDGDSDYATNLRSVAQPDTVSGRNVPLLASTVAVHQRIQEQEAARRAAREQEEQNPSQHIGAKGDKIKDVEATVLGVRYIDGAYGVTTLLTFADADGNVMKWFASGRKDDIEVGDKVTIAGTIKDHGEFRGVAETVLTRVKYVGTPGTETGDRHAVARAAEAEAAARTKALYEYEESPDGMGRFVPVDDPASIPVGTMIRYQQGNPSSGYTYGDGYVVSGVESADYTPAELTDPRFLRIHPINHDSDGKDVVVSGGAGRVVWLDNIKGVAKDQDHTTGTTLADSYFPQARVPGGFTAINPGDAALGQIGAGTTVRISGGGYGTYINVTVVSRSGDDFLVRYPDGHEDTISADTIKSSALAKR